MSDESQIYIWTFSTYDGQNCHRIHLSNFLKQGIRVQLLIRINN